MFFVVDHPCVKAKLTLLRDERTDSKHFREYVGEITCFIAYEALKNLETEEIPVKTPLCETTGCRIRNSVAVVPILRAGIGMLDGILKLVPDATVGFVGLERDHVTAEPREYYCKLPAAEADSLAVVVDPMLATGGSLAATVEVLKRNGFARIVVISILAAPEGREAMERLHPDVKVYTGALDAGLNERKYILPGLGDAGDRIFGTL